MVGTSGPSSVSPGQRDPNPILDIGCPRSAGGIESAIALCLAMGLDFELEPLDCAPFYHGYGENCSDAKLTIGILRLPLEDPKGNKVKIPFYITKGDGALLLGNSILKNASILGSENIVKLPPGSVPNLHTFASIPTYTTKDEELRTHLHVVTSQLSQFKSYISSTKHVLEEEGRGEATRILGRSAKDFGTKLHMYTHMTPRDMGTLCERAGIMTPTPSSSASSCCGKV